MRWQSGQTGYFFGSRLGTQTLPHSATTGVPFTCAEVMSDLRAQWENRSWSPPSVLSGTVVRAVSDTASSLPSSWRRIGHGHSTALPRSLLVGLSP